MNINAHEYYGLSTDKKPIDCPTGSSFLEMDTKAVYVFDENENLINPKIQKLQSKINHLEKQKKELENQIKLLTK